jgi:hypothetical protein
MACSIALLFQQAPQEIKINAATFAGGIQPIPEPEDAVCSQYSDSICVVLGGRAAETMVLESSRAATGQK